MRVIAGSAGGLKLDVPKNGVRPTMDRVKAAIFSSLGDKVIGARVLDLFAGAGGLGIEALSRGAESVLFVESDRHAIACIERNLLRTKLAGRVRRLDVVDFLNSVPETERYDIVFADPPYDETVGGESFTSLLLSHHRLPQLLDASGLFVLEKRPGESLPHPIAWEVVRSRAYGATEVVVLRHPLADGTGNAE